jgi:predicted metalloprotease
VTLRPSSPRVARPGRAARLAVLTLVVVVLAAGLVGIRLGALQVSAAGRLTTEPLLGRLTSAPAADGTGSVTRAATATDELTFLRFVVGDVQATWQGLFTTAGISYRPTQLVLYRDVVRSGCGRATAEVGPFYCPVDEEVYLDVGFFDELANRFGAPGDFAQAYVIAHEIGHHVQNQLGITSEVGAAQRSDPTVENDLSVRTELQADCLAGVWGHSAFERSEVEPGDLQEAIDAAAAVGDDRLQRATTGEVNPDTFTHGTSAQRVAWFLAGYRTGDPGSCDSFQRDMPAASDGGEVSAPP